MKVPTILQSEAAECGLACLAMVAAAHGAHHSLRELRSRVAVGHQGLGLRSLMAVAADLGLQPRPLRAELSDLHQVRVPCVLHWDLQHYVVLERATARHLTLIDPAQGRSRWTLEQASPHFTGVVLELMPTSSVQRRPADSMQIWRDWLGPLKQVRTRWLIIATLALCLELLAITGPWYSQLVIDEVLPSGDTDLLGLLALGFSVVLGLQLLLQWLRGQLSSQLQHHLGHQWGVALLRHVLSLPPSYFEHRSLGELGSRWESLQVVQRGLVGLLLEGVVDALMAALALVLMLLYAPALSALVVASVLAVALLRWWAHAPLRDLAAQHWQQATQSANSLFETLRAMATVKQQGAEPERLLAWQQFQTQQLRIDLQMARSGHGYAVVQSAILGGESLAVLYWGAKAMVERASAEVGPPTWTVGMLFAFLAYRAQFTARAMALIDRCAAWGLLRVHLERLADTTQEPPEELGPTLGAPSERAALSLELVDVGYCAAQGQPWVLRHVHLHVEAGEHVAISGPSGCGKSTLLKIALGLLEPTEGEVRYGGVPLRQWGLRQARAVTSAVLQDDVLLAGSIAENITFFAAGASPDRIEVCARMAQLHDEIVRMPMAYLTRIGELGAGLSAGQRQRLLMARALYRQPSILIMDEATSHLDLEREAAIVSALNHLPMTRIQVAHRPQSLQAAQRIVHWPELFPTELNRSSTHEHT